MTSFENIPKLTTKQFAILTLIYRFRFLNRIHIQTILKHKDYRRINAWLKDLTDKQCIERLYSHTMPENTKPAVYYLGKYGRKWLSGDDHYLGFEELEMSYLYNDLQLEKTYKDGQRTEAFRLDCLTIADCFLILEESTKKQNQKLYARTNSEYYFDEELENLNPDLYFIVYPDTKDYEPEEEEVYYLYYITNRKQKRFIRYRIAHIINYFQDEEYRDLEEAPRQILFVAATTPLKNYAKRVLERKLEQVREDLHIECKFTTLAEFKKFGLYGDIWKKPKQESY